MIVPLERLEAVLLAGAAGDGIGGVFEGAGPDPERRVPAPPWRFSDDTRMTFATCRGIALSKRPIAARSARGADHGIDPRVAARFARGADHGIDPAVLAREYLVEFRAGLPGVGSSTLKAMRDLAAGQHWALAGARGEYAAGNGAAMRVAPLAFFGDIADPPFARLVRDVASITHRHDEAIAGAVAVVSAMQRVAVREREPSRAVLASLVEDLPDTALSDALTALVALRADANALDAAALIGASGRAAESVALALFVGCSASSLEVAIRDALSCGGDTDTIASIAAQVCAAAGAELPNGWVPHLPTEEVRRLSLLVVQGGSAENGTT